MATTAEYRTETLSKLEKRGCIGITEEMRSAIIAIVERGYVIQSEEYTGWRMTLYVNPSSDVSSRARYDIDGELYKFGGSPWILGTDFTLYRMSFIANQ